jgi:hypothetical protein
MTSVLVVEGSGRAALNVSWQTPRGGNSMTASENRPNYPAGPQWPAARLPIPGNAEWVWWVVASIVVMIVAWVADSVNAPMWVDFFKWTTAAYLLSRGIAKASRVLEQ